MTALATQADVEAVIGRTLTADEAAKVAGKLAAASALVRSVTGRLFEAGPVTVTRRVRGGKVVLDSPASVEAVRHLYSDGDVAEIAAESWTLRGSTLYVSGCWVEVDYTNDGVVPAEVVEVAAAVAARELTEPEANLTRKTVGPFSEEYRDGSGTTRTTLAEDRILSRHKLPGAGTIRLMP